MSDKPSFRDFYRAHRLSKVFEENQLYVYDRKKGKRVLYNKLPLKTRYRWQSIGAGIALIICAAVAVPWFIYRDRILFLSSTIMDLLFFMFFVSQFIGNFIINKFIYGRMDFTKISETDWDDAKESEYRKSRFWSMRFLWILMAGIYLFVILTIGFTPVYIRYLADRALGTPWQAEVKVYTSDDYDNYIELNEETKPETVFVIEDFDKSKEVQINLKTIRSLERTSIYINGEDIGFKNDGIFGDMPAGITGHFWSDRYFEIYQSGHIIFRPVEGINTLELKSDSFYKKWTFTLEYE